MTGGRKLYQIDSLQWMRMIRDGIDLPKSTKAVAFCLALYAKPDGTSIHPGINRLAWGAGCSRRSVITALRELERWGLIHCHHRGSSMGTANAASTYQLTTHDKVSELATEYDQWLKINGIGHPASWAEPF